MAATAMTTDAKMKTLYFDLDDVLANFNEYANSMFGTDYKVGQMLKLEHWHALCNDHPRMFRLLKPNMGAIDLVREIFVQKNAPQIRLLTALPFDENHIWQYAATDKFRWCDEHLMGIPMFVGPYAHDKWKHCKPGDLLVDDKQSNCDEWIAAGGEAFLYREDNEAAEKWIKERL